MKFSWQIILILGGLICQQRMAYGDEAAERLLESKELRKVGSTWVLSAESELSRQMSQTAKIKRTVVDAGKKLVLAERQAESKKQTLNQWKAQHVQLSAQLANARSVAENNRIVGLLNALAGQIELGSQDQAVENNLKAARSTANEVREQYAQHVLDMRAAFDGLQNRYTLLAADPEVTLAIEGLNKASEKKVELGPSRGLSSFERSLVKLEETVLSEDIQTRQGAGNLMYVSAVFGGKEAIELAVDTGASAVVLSWELAEKLGLKPGPEAERVVFVVADGRRIEARMVKAGSVRVGKFTVENVDCAVFGPENTDVEPLLGQSFLENFVYKIDSARGVISMTRIEDQASGKR